MQNNQSADGGEKEESYSYYAEPATNFGDFEWRDCEGVDVGL